MPPEGYVILNLALFGGAVLLLWPLVHALADRVRKGGRAPEIPAEVLAELSELRADVAQLAERLDFAERLLTKQREAERLAPPR
jgi:hypothetical protein